jgi:hypothetical protein
MATERSQSGSRLGRAVVDWEKAFVFYAALPAQTRSYGAVATEFGVSPRTVERQGRQRGWTQRLSEIDAAAAAETDQRLGQARAEQTVKLRKLIDVTFIAYADNLRRGDVRIGPADLDRLHKLWRQLDNELEHPPARAVTPAVTRTPEHTAAVLQALREAGALDALGLHSEQEET